MDLTEGSETSEKLNLTSGKYPKENVQNFKHIYCSVFYYDVRLTQHKSCLVYIEVTGYMFRLARSHYQASYNHLIA
jgi:hypothetical protein